MVLGSGVVAGAAAGSPDGSSEGDDPGSDETGEEVVPEPFCSGSTGGVSASSSTWVLGWRGPSLVMSVLSVSMAGADEAMGAWPFSVPSCPNALSRAATGTSGVEVAGVDCVWFPSTKYHPATCGGSQPNHLA
jgi:hypothetical protein